MGGAQPEQMESRTRKVKPPEVDVGGLGMVDNVREYGHSRWVKSHAMQ